MDIESVKFILRSQKEKGKLLLVSPSFHSYNRVKLAFDCYPFRTNHRILCWNFIPRKSNSDNPEQFHKLFKRFTNISQIFFVVAANYECWNRLKPMIWISKVLFMILFPGIAIWCHIFHETFRRFYLPIFIAFFCLTRKNWNVNEVETFCLRQFSIEK